MGVDYTANYGIGFKVSYDSGEEDFNLSEHLDELIYKTNYQYFETGHGAYTGEENEFYVVLNDDIDIINDLKVEGEKLKEFLLKHELINDSQQIELHGGLHIH